VENQEKYMTDDAKTRKQFGQREARDFDVENSCGSLEKALRESETKFRALFEKGPIGVAYHRMIYNDAGEPWDYFFLDANEQYQELTGVDPRNKTVRQAFPGIENDPSDWIGTFGRVARTGEQVRFEQYLQTNNRWYDCVAYRYKPDHFVSAFLDITERKQMEETLARTVSRLNLATRAGGVGIWEYDIITNKLNWDEQMQNLYGLTPQTFRNAYDSWEERVHPEDRDEAAEILQKAIRGEIEYNTEFRVVWPDGSIHVLRALGMVQRDERGTPLFMVGTNWDITAVRAAVAERERLQQQMFQLQKMEAIGQLSGGIAHDFNNQLAGILGYAELLSRELKDEALKGYLENIRLGAQNAANLTQQLLLFSRKGRYKFETVNLHSVLDEVMGILSHTIDKRIEISREPGMANPTVQGDPSQIQNAVLNIALNARDAITGNGTITFKTFPVTIKKTGEHPLFSLDPGSYVCLTVADDGCGMEEKTLSQIFDPFFTTKEVGKGTGMGLPAAYGTIKHHGGDIFIESVPDGGSSFHILLPYSSEVVPASDPSPDIIRAQRAASILVVDDDDIVRGLMTELLENLGYTVYQAADGEQGLQFYQDHRNQIDIVLLDMIMPRKSGEELFYALREINSEVKILVSSGYSPNDEAISKILSRGARFIQKPTTLGELSEAVAAILGE
jgi:PAS domain S-box-containing protein